VSAALAGGAARREVLGHGPSTRPAAPPVLRVLPAPSTDPAAEGQDWGDEISPAARTRYVQGCLAVDFRADADDAFFGPQATSTPDLPDAVPWARRMIQALLESYEGVRSPDQLSRWVVPEIRERASRRGLLARRRGRRPARPPVVRSVHPCFPADGVCEIASVVWVDGRVRALALRMSGVDGRWLVTAWELG
jgi:hypothetical protein